MTFKTAALAALLLATAGPALAQQSNKAGDASNQQQNGENSQTKTGGQAGGSANQQ